MFLFQKQSTAVFIKRARPPAGSVGHWLRKKYKYLTAQESYVYSVAKRRVDSGPVFTASNECWCCCDCWMMPDMFANYKISVICQSWRFFCTRVAKNRNFPALYCLVVVWWCRTSKVTLTSNTPTMLKLTFGDLMGHLFMTSSWYLPSIPSAWHDITSRCWYYSTATSEFERRFSFFFWSATLVITSRFLEQSKRQRRTNGSSIVRRTEEADLIRTTSCCRRS